MFGGRQLPDGAALAAAGVTEEDTLYILARLLGGGKKRKKKTYTKPKKQKHKHKKIKMRVLKFFKARGWLPAAVAFTAGRCFSSLTLYTARM